MKFKRAMPLWLQPFLILFFFMCSFLVLFGMTYENWVNIVVGSISLIALTVGTIFIYKSATYTLTTDYLHIKGINNGKSVDVMIALLQDNERVILLWNCWLYQKEEFVNTSPPETIIKKYVSCPIMNVRHLEYKSVDDALIDTKWNDSLKKEVRKVDVIAYSHMRDEQI